MNYQNPTFQWAKLVLGILAVIGVGVITFKVMQPTNASKDNYEPGAQSVSYVSNNYGLFQSPGCASWRTAVKPESIKTNSAR